MANFELVTFTSPAELARAAAEQWLAQLTKTITTPFCVALSGGRIAGAFFSETAAQAKASPKLLEPVHFFWGDERCVLPSDSESNFALARDLLFEPLGISGSRIHRVHGEAEPELAAGQAAADLRGTAPSNAAGQPILDLVFLGMGENGHVASLFPEEPESAITDPAVYRPVTTVKPPPRRITLGYPTIAAARQVWVLASGSGKEQALRESLSPQGRTPLARVLKMRARTRILTDIRTPSPPGEPGGEGEGKGGSS